MQPLNWISCMIDSLQLCVCNRCNRIGLYLNTVAIFDLSSDVVRETPQYSRRPHALWVCWRQDCFVTRSNWGGCYIWGDCGSEEQYGRGGGCGRRSVPNHHILPVEIKARWLLQQNLYPSNIPSHCICDLWSFIHSLILSPHQDKNTHYLATTICKPNSNN